MEPAAAQGLNNLDLVVLGVILTSGVFALFAGFVREFFSLAAWIGAYFASATYFPLAEPLIKKYTKNETFIEIGAMVGVFVAVLILLMIIGHLISYLLVRGRAVTAIDRSLGFIFGILRGVFIVCIVYGAAVYIWWPDIDKPPDETKTAEAKPREEDKPPELLMEAKTRPAMAYGAKLLEKFIPEKELSKTKQEYNKQKEAAQRMIDQKALDILSTPVPPGSKDGQAPQYDDKNRNNLDKLINQQGQP
jgi:membrane protein required for colicin V production